MHTISVRVPSADFADRMSAMRLWLDDHRFEPFRFTYSEEGNNVLVDVGFKSAAEAAAFSAQFA
jgi:outer membrane lipoprotein-sorting protein